MWGPVLAFAVLQFILSSQASIPMARFVWDKALHTIAYATLGVLAIRAFHQGLKPLRVAPTMMAMALTVSYGISDEIHQSFVPGRQASAMDLLADVIGFVLAALLVHIRFRIPGGERHEL